LSSHLLQTVFDFLQFLLTQPPKFCGKLVDLVFEIAHTDAGGDFLVTCLGELAKIEIKSALIVVLWYGYMFEYVWGTEAASAFVGVGGNGKSADR